MLCEAAGKPILCSLLLPQALQEIQQVTLPQLLQVLHVCTRRLPWLLQRFGDVVRDAGRGLLHFLQLRFHGRLPVLLQQRLGRLRHVEGDRQPRHHARPLHPALPAEPARRQDAQPPPLPLRGGQGLVEIPFHGAKRLCEVHLLAGAQEVFDPDLPKAVEVLRGRASVVHRIQKGRLVAER
eukprot:scaffold913_cov233-Pinguiococcus_pyrenoidosus.AAC.10